MNGNHMKKHFFGVVMAVSGSILLAGCSQPSAPVVDQPDVSVRTNTEVREPEQPGGSAGWVAGLMSGKKMRCTYAVAMGEGNTLTTTMFADKDRYRTEVELPTGTTVSIFDGKAMYTFTKGTKQGMKMDIECAKGLKDSLPKTDQATVPVPQTYDSPETAIGNVPDIACAETSESPDFSIPSDITFVDQCAMLKASLDQMKNIQNQIPDGVRGMTGR